MSDQSFMSWPFFEDHHRTLAAELSHWAAANVPALIDHHDTDGSCKRLVKALGDAGWLRVAVRRIAGFAGRGGGTALATCVDTLAQNSSTAAVTAQVMAARRSGDADSNSSPRLMIEPASSSTAGMRACRSTMS